jgi:hypothetical protein
MRGNCNAHHGQLMNAPAASLGFDGPFELDFSAMRAYVRESGGAGDDERGQTERRGIAASFECEIHDFTTTDTIAAILRYIAASSSWPPNECQFSLPCSLSPVCMLPLLPSLLSFVARRFSSGCRSYR